MRRFVLSSCLAVVAVTTGAALADSTTNSLPEAASTATNRLPEVVVTGTRIPSETECTPIDVTVLQGDELTSQQIRTVSDALREVPGVGIVQRGQPGGQTSVFLRGGNANHTLVLIDGIRVNDGFNSQFDFSNLSMDNVDRIEVLRGPQSTLYGSEAIGGVINIITKTGSDKPTGAATFEGGSFNSIRPSVSFATNSSNDSISPSPVGIVPRTPARPVPTRLRPTSPRSSTTKIPRLPLRSTRDRSTAGTRASRSRTTMIDFSGATTSGRITRGSRPTATRLTSKMSSTSASNTNSCLVLHSITTMSIVSKMILAQRLSRRPGGATPATASTSSRRSSGSRSPPARELIHSAISAAR